MRSRNCSTRRVRRRSQLTPVTRLTSDPKDLSYSFIFNDVRFVGLDEYVKGNVSQPAVSPEDRNAIESLQLPVGVNSTVVFGHVPDQSPSTTKPKNPVDYFKGGHPYYLLNGLSFFKVDINVQKGLYYFAGHDHGYFPPRNGATPIDVHANHYLEQVVSAAGLRRQHTSVRHRHRERWPGHGRAESDSQVAVRTSRKDTHHNSKLIDVAADNSIGRDGDF